jgi:hypothetical protein
MRVYDPRAGRFLSLDPLQKRYPWYTPYQFAGNMPIWAIDLDGLEEMKVNSVAHVIKDINGNIITKPTIITDPERSLDNIPGVRRLNGNEIEVTPGLVSHNNPTFNTLTYRQVNLKDFTITQSNTAVGQDAGGGIKPPKTNLEQNPNDDLPPGFGAVPIITPITTVDVKNQTLKRNINFVPGYSEFASKIDKSIVDQVAKNAPNSVKTGATETTTNGNETKTTQTTTQVRSIITIDLRTDIYNSTYGRNLLDSRYQLLKRQLIAAGVPAQNIKRGSTQFNQPDSSLGGNTNQTIFKVQTSTTETKTGTSTTNQ